MAKTGTNGIDINAWNGDVTLSNDLFVTGSATVVGITASGNLGAVDVVASGNVSGVDVTASGHVIVSAYATLDFLDDGAAAVGGVPVGGVYHTSGALKVRVA